MEGARCRASATVPALATTEEGARLAASATVSQVKLAIASRAVVPSKSSTNKTRIGAGDSLAGAIKGHPEPLNLEVR